MKSLLVMLLLNCLLASAASGQHYAQLGDEFGNFAEELSKRNREEGRVQRDLVPSGENEQQTNVSAREASDRARSAYPGRVLSVRLDGRRWRVRMDEEGTVFNVFVDSENGEVRRSD
ncbi:MAG: PepSY domain-containing protein [Pseudomonadota bacterium]